MRVLYSMIGIVVMSLILMTAHLIYIRIQKARKTPKELVEVKTSYDFQRFVCLRAVNKKGFQKCNVGPRGADKGVDGMGWKNGKKYVIQCKRYKKTSFKVEEARELVGIGADHMATPILAILEQTKVTKEAREYMQRMEIEVRRF